MPLRKSDNRKLKQIFILCIMFSFLYLENSLSYQIVKQETIGPGEVELVRFGSTLEETAYPKFVIFSDRIEVRDYQSQPLVQNALVDQKGVHEFIAVSNEGRYFAWVENHAPPFSLWKEQAGTQVITLYNDTGQVVRTHTWSLYEDIPTPDFEISDFDGTLAASYSPDYPPTMLYRPDGREIPYKEGAPYFRDFDFSSQVPLLGAIGGRSGRLSVMLFNLDGNELWEQTLNKENPHEAPRFIRLSPKGSFVLAGTVAGYKKTEEVYTAETRLYLFDKAGKLLIKRFFSGDQNPHRRTYPEYVYAVDFSPQERFVGLALLDAVLVWDLTTGTEAYRTSLPDPGVEDRQMLRISVNDLGEVLVLTGNWEKVDVGQSRKFRLGAQPQAFLFSSEGALLWKQGFQAPAKNRIAPLSHRSLKPEIRSRSDLEALLTEQDIYLFIDNTFYHIRK